MCCTDETLAAEMRRWEKHLANFTSEIVGESHVYLEGDRIYCRTQECNLGNLICDAVLRSANDRFPEEGTWARASAAIWNSGGIRATIEQGRTVQIPVISSTQNITIYILSLTSLSI